MPNVITMGPEKWKKGAEEELRDVWYEDSTAHCWLWRWRKGPQAKECGHPISSVQFSCSDMSDSAILWTAARQASPSITTSQSLLKLMSIELVMPSKHLILCCPLLLPPSIFPSISVLSNESVLRIRWPVLEFQLQHQSFPWIQVFCLVLDLYHSKLFRTLSKMF